MSDLAARLRSARTSAWLRRAIIQGVNDALTEDVRDGDITAALVPAAELSRARVITREAGIFCGRHWVEETCRQVDPRLQVHQGRAGKEESTGREAGQDGGG